MIGREGNLTIFHSSVQTKTSMVFIGPTNLTGLSKIKGLAQQAIYLGLEVSSYLLLRVPLYEVSLLINLPLIFWLGSLPLPRHSGLLYPLLQNS